MITNSPQMASNSANFCEACKKLVNGTSRQAKLSVAKPTPYTQLIHHDDGGLGLRKGCKERCLICLEIWTALTEDERWATCSYHVQKSKFDASPEFMSEDFATKYRIAIDDKGRTILYYSCHYGRCIEPQGSGTYLDFGPEVLRQFVLIAAQERKYETITPDLETCTAGALRLIEKWLQTCGQDHKHEAMAGMGGSSATSLPTRLLNVGTIASPKLNLVEGISNRATRYIALSHCWGSLDFLKLKRSNLGEFKRSIPEGRLTKTFRDAIQLTRELKLQYLWIDSLCIVQDDSKDWEREAARMLAVYYNSYCSISATGAENGEKGLFFARDEVIVPPVVLEIPSSAATNITANESGISRAVTSLKTRRLLLTDSDIWHHGILESHTGSRAWCLQERVLSPRTIHFSEKQLFFECQSFQACSKFPNGIPSEAIPKSESKVTSSLGSIHLRSQKELKPKDIVQSWKNLVTIYSACKLTRYSDKLIALSGLAEYTSKLLVSAEYYAGLWSEEIYSQLLWFIVDFDPGYGPNARPRDFQAPTWSWASVNHSVQFEEQFEEGSAMGSVDIGESSIECGGPIGFGQVSGGSLKLFCTLIPARGILRVPNGQTFNVDFGYDLVIRGANVHIMPIWDCKTSIGRLKRLFCAPLLRLQAGGIVGLVLERVEKQGDSEDSESEEEYLDDDVQKKFMRRGLFRMNDLGWWTCQQYFEREGDDLLRLGMLSLGDDLDEETASELAEDGGMKFWVQSHSDIVEII